MAKKDSAPVEDHKIMFLFRLNKYIKPKHSIKIINIKIYKVFYHQGNKLLKEKTQMKIEWFLIIYQ